MADLRSTRIPVLLAVLFGAPALLGAEGAAQNMESDLATATDCAEILLQGLEDASLTREERIALLDQALLQSLNNFDPCQAGAGSAAGGGGTGGGAGSGASGGVAGSGAGSGASGGAAGGGAGSGASGGVAGGGAGSGASGGAAGGRAGSGASGGAAGGRAGSGASGGVAGGGAGSGASGRAAGGAGSVVKSVPVGDIQGDSANPQPPQGALAGGGAVGGVQGTEGSAGESGAGSVAESTPESVPAGDIQGDLADPQPPQDAPADGKQETTVAGKTNPNALETVGANGKPPEDIPPAKNDDIIAKQFRKAAVEETDPVAKAKLWNEYRRYKNLPVQEVPET